MILTEANCVASQVMTERSAFADIKNAVSKQLTIGARDGLSLASFGAAKGKRDALVAAIRDKYGLTLPSSPMRVEGEEVAILWSGPDQWIAVAERTNNRDLEQELKQPLAGLASVVDQTDARAIVRISGPRSRDVLAKGVPIDLHPRVFGPGSVAITHASHVGIMLWQLDAVPTYELAVFRSFAQSLTEWLEASARAME
jgi:sarcosine oxidase subunit gamma